MTDRLRDILSTLESGALINNPPNRGKPNILEEKILREKDLLTINSKKIIERNSEPRNVNNLIDEDIRGKDLLTINSKKIIERNSEPRNVNNLIDEDIRGVVFNSRNDSEFNRLLEQIRNGQIRTPREGTTTSFSSRYGLGAKLGIFLEQRGVVVGGQRVLRFGDSYTRVDFIPDGRAQKVNSKVTDSIEKGIKGMTELVVAVDRGEVRVAPFLMGRTNINMALFAQRLGFKVEDTDRKPDGTIDTEKGSFTVVAKLEDVRQKLAEFAASGVTEKISQRAARLRPQTA